MVFVAMSDEEGLDLVSVVFEVGVIGDDVIDAGEVGLRETDAGIDHDKRTVALEAVGVLPDFPESSERVNANRRIGHNNFLAETLCWIWFVLASEI